MSSFAAFLAAFLAVLFAACCFALLTCLCCCSCSYIASIQMKFAIQADAKPFAENTTSREYILQLRLQLQ